MDIPVDAGQADDQIVAIFILLFRQRQVIQIGFRIGFLLPSVLVQELAKVTFTIEQADPHQGHFHGRGGLEMIAGQDTQSPGKQGQGLMDTELHGKVGYRLPLVPGTLAIGLVQHPILKALAHLLQVGQVAVILGQFIESLLGNLGGEHDGISARRFPQPWVDAPKQFDGVLIPAPPEIARQRLQERERFRDIGKNLECLNKPHDGTP